MKTNPFNPLNVMLVIVVFLIHASDLIYAQDTPQWDNQEVEYYETFLSQRDEGDYSDAAATAEQWLIYAKNEKGLNESYYSFVQEADYADFHEAVLSEAWREIAADDSFEISEQASAMGQWLQYLRDSYGDGDPRTIAGYIALADVYREQKKYEEAITLLKWAETTSVTARSETKNSVPAPLYLSALDRLVSHLQIVRRSDEATIYNAKAEAVIRSSGPSDQMRDGKVNYRSVQVFFGTDRKATGKRKLNEWFGGEQADGISYGSCHVSIPLKHKRGEIERPKWWKLEFREDPTKHVSIVNLDPDTRDVFYSALGASIKESAGDSSANKAFVFVHGFNVTFTEAARHTAQIAHDLAFEGAPIFFSWASRGSVGNYMTDETTIQLSQDYLKEFLVDIANNTEAEEIYLIAHSMGTRALTKAFPSAYAELGARKEIFKEIILAAPDIDRKIFLRQIAPALANTKIPVTIYTSVNDKALKTSKTIRANLPRLGEDAAVLAGLPSLEPIDASIIRSDFTSHSYFSDDKSLIFDLHQLIRDAKRAGNRTGTLSEAMAVGGKKYWKVRP